MRWKEILVEGSKMRCYIARPQQANGGGVLVAMHGPGIDDFIIDICERLASNGFVAIAPDFYHRQSQPLIEAWTKIKDTQALEDMAKAIDELKNFPSVDKRRLAMIGFCMGGRLTFLHAANNSELRAAVVFHGGNIMVSGDTLSPFEQAKNIVAPILGIFGAQDDNPSPSDVEKIAAKLTLLGKIHNFNIYQGAGHAFLNFTRLSAFCPLQAKEAWDKCLAWLNQYLFADA
ncbi:MAG: dienelactone hydrolase family protein [Acidobacteria bacterium]|nr:dienelactone hydrolase family protein [Acidobacteriota bacterium]